MGGERRKAGALSLEAHPNGLQNPERFQWFKLNPNKVLSLV